MSAYPMWVTKRTATLQDRVGFQSVTAAQRTALLAAGAAMDTFNATSFIDTAPRVVLDPDAVVSTTHATPASPVDTTVATLSATGGTEPYTFIAINTDGGNFKIAGNAVKTAVTGITVGAHTFTFIARDSLNHVSPVTPVTIPIDEVAAPPARSEAPQPTARKTVFKRTASK